MTSIDMSRIKEHMDVRDAAGESIGKVDHVQDGRLKLTKSDSPDGQHHFVPFDWIERIDAHVHLNKSLKDIRSTTHAGNQASGDDAVPRAKPHDAVP